jgi:hypothetical protein
MLHFDRTGELKRRFLLTAVERNRNAQLRVRALQEIAAAKDAEAFDLSIDVIGTWAREERREGTKVMFQALAEKRIGRRDQANAWIWRLAEYTREVHEEYAVQRWPETKRLLGLLVNSSGGAHARNARRLVHAARKQDRRLQAALLAAAVAHTPEAEEVLRGARTRLARKPSALSRELLRNFPKGKGRRSRRRRKKAAAAAAGRTVVGAAQTRAGPDEEPLDDAVATTTVDGASANGAGEIRENASDGDAPSDDKPASRSRSRRSRRRKDADPERAAPIEGDAAAEPQPTPAAATASETGADEQPESADGDGARPARKRRPRRAASAASDASDGAEAADATSEAPVADGDKPAEKPKPKPRRPRKAPAAKKAEEDGDGSPADSPADSPAEAA